MAERVFVYLDDETYQKLKDLCEQAGVATSAYVREVLREKVESDWLPPQSTDRPTDGPGTWDRYDLDAAKRRLARLEKGTSEPKAPREQSTLRRAIEKLESTSAGRSGRVLSGPQREAMKPYRLFHRS